MGMDWKTVDFGFWLQLLVTLGPKVYTQLQELFSDKIPTIDQLKSQSGQIWAKIAEEQAKV